ncbi:hypothetical protein HMPREF6745_0070 [Prevotella sp. oral taxon 472 str. F0295]|nr:hypothetical protein HMPREF6745_0070 [Prevotella sp. oral taxon 472 str. F0295]
MQKSADDNTLIYTLQTPLLPKARVAFVGYSKAMRSHLLGLF